VISRKAYQVAALSGLHMDGGTAAYQRMIGGIIIGVSFAMATHFFGSSGNLMADRGEGGMKMWG